MLRHRLLFGALLITVLGGLLYVDHSFAGPLQLGRRVIRHEGAVVTLVLSLLCVLGTIEMCRLAEGAGHAPPRLWVAFSNYLIVLLPYLIHNGLIGDGSSSAARVTLISLVAAFFGACLLVAARCKTEHALSNIAVTLLIVFYMGLLPTFLLRLRIGEDGACIPLLVYFIAVVKCCDIGAYFTGRAFGRHKLIEWLSPKKTVEGLVGGMALSMIVAVGLSKWSALQVWTIDGQSAPIPPMIAAVFGLVMAVVGQGGDLLESLFKRDAQVKDSAQLVPAFGGVLDLMDSLLPTAPIACLILLK